MNKCLFVLFLMLLLVAGCVAETPVASPSMLESDVIQETPANTPTIAATATEPMETTPASQTASLPSTPTTTAPATKLTPVFPPKLSLGTPVIEDMKVSVNGVTMPDGSGTTILRIRWDWGDGSSGDQWFPASHTYSKAGLYTVNATSFQSNGLSTVKSVTVRVPPYIPTPMPPVVGSYSGFFGFPSNFFDESALPMEMVVKVTDAQYLSLRKVHDERSPYGFCRIEYEPSHYGSTTPYGLKLGDAAFPGKNAGNHRWEVMAHEQGHNFFGGTSSFYISLATPYPFLQESLAVMSAFYTYNDLLDNRTIYGLDDAAIKSLDFDFANGRSYQQAMYEQYISQGKRFDIGQVLTSQALDYKMITYGEKYGWQTFRSLVKAFGDGAGTRFTFHQDGATATEQSTYVVAALSAAFGHDFKTEFKELNFPIDDSLYDEWYKTIKAYIDGN